MKWILVAALSFVGCQRQTHFDCADSVKRELISPDGRYVALMFERDCGATTSVSTLVAIRESRKRLDLKEARLILSLKESWDLALEWNSPQALTIHLPEGARTYTKLATWQGVQITYR
ncbi:MAG: hypothetical protein ABI639_06045 [Thermoanaerobaculia bacterium]